MRGDRITDGLDLDGAEGTVLLGYVQTDGNVTLWKGVFPSTALHIGVGSSRMLFGTDQPLAKNVALSDGVVNVRCPLNLPTTLRYVVACKCLCTRIADFAADPRASPRSARR